jgi:transcriptional regulator with XRE-family HTH domain
MILGYRLRELRKENRLSQEKLGKILGVSKVSVSGYENGNRIPSLDILNKILDFFGVSADYLMGRELDMVCEENNLTFKMSSLDVEIIKEMHNNPIVYNNISKNPRRFFNTFDKKNI